MNKPTRDPMAVYTVVSCSIGILWLLYLAVAIEAFQWRNPKANSRVGWRHPYEVITFTRLPEYQEDTAP